MNVRVNLVVPLLLACSLGLSACEVRTDPSRQKEAGGAVSQPAWTDALAGQLRKAIEARAAHGLDRMSFALEQQAGDADRDAALTRAALAYAGALARGAADPTKLFDIYTVPRPRADLRAGLARAMQEGKLDEWLEGLAPDDDNYRRLSQAYLRLRKSSNGPPAPIPDAGKPIEPGKSDPRIPTIAAQLVAFDYLDKAAVGGTVYTPPMVAAVKRMQADYGIDPDGMIGTDALEILNLSDADRARAIAVNMERLRWLERNPPATRIDVNLAAARLAYWRDGKLVDTRRVVVGEPETATPQIGSPILRLVANPTWTVPRSIQRKEIAGKGTSYLRRNNMVWKDGWIVQQPGPKNALGLVKFDMENEHSIYLHDTPAKALFKEVQRQRSHGCVRVEDAVGFAEMLARDQGVEAEWQRAHATGKESYVTLTRPVPVRMLYQTVLFDESGEPVVRSDPYGWNDRVASALGFPASTGFRVKTRAADVGP
ncbi:L,D-transpeptidase family protein [Sphingomonas paucimobilis]|uniref:L,D-transpeptidase family protein n=1 Tax=Sphingomonas paucimobilis TaxID=13689 RepID=UPI0020422768|nr:L,D-transpeptidase family protein [Sphingomonas paucimobilis]MCM3681105.1 L,D-transpeptidase family protein [Sphingomonas paucimobilis]